MKRQLIVSIDGDGFIYRTAFNGSLVGEVIRDEIIARYPFRFCTSVIAGEAEYYASEFDMETARSIFALPNVDAASHSWSHPHDWSSSVDLEQEVTRSVDFINDKLLPAGKAVETFLWTGMCNPSPSAIAHSNALKIDNLNGGNFAVPYSGPGDSRQYHARARSDWHWMGMEKLLASAKSPSVYSLFRDYPGDLGGFRQVKTFFESHREIPVHVYFHWYSGVREDSLAALIDVLDWCMTQDLQPLSVRDYIKQGNDGRLL